MPDLHTFTSDNTPLPRRARVSGSGPIARVVGQTLRDDGWRLAPDDDADAAWLVQVVAADTTDAGAVLAGVRAFAARVPSHVPTHLPTHGGLVLILDLTHAQARAGAPLPPFAEALALRTLLAAVPLLALELAPRLRVNGIGIVPAAADHDPGTPEADIAAALRFVIDAPALTGQMIALDGGRTALVPTPGLGTSDQT